MVEEKMKEQDMERMEQGLPLTEREELMTMARKAESAVLKLEAEYMVAGVPLRPPEGGDATVKLGGWARPCARSPQISLGDFHSTRSEGT